MCDGNVSSVTMTKGGRERRETIKRKSNTTTNTRKRNYYRGGGTAEGKGKDVIRKIRRL